MESRGNRAMNDFRTAPAAYRANRMAYSAATALPVTSLARSALSRSRIWAGRRSRGWQRWPRRFDPLGCAGGLFYSARDAAQTCIRLAPPSALVGAAFAQSVFAADAGRAAGPLDLAFCGAAIPAADG